MVLLTLIALAQLVVLVLLLGVVLEQVARQEIERATAEHSVQRQTIDALLEAAAYLLARIRIEEQRKSGYQSATGDDAVPDAEAEGSGEAA